MKLLLTILLAASMTALAQSGPFSAKNKWGQIALYANPANGGTCTGGGQYRVNTVVTIQALPASGWLFSRWGDSVTNATRQVYVKPGTATYNAYFSQVPPPPPTNTTRSVTLGWNPAPSSSVVGYNVYYGCCLSGTYTNRMPVGNVTAATISGLLIGSPYFFSAKSMDSKGFESVFSNEVQFTP